MSFQELSQFKYQVKNVLNKMVGLNKCRKDFFISTMSLFLSIKGRINFLQLERFSDIDEQSFRNQFEKPFDFLKFNKELVLEHGSGHFTIAFDPSYISKSGKHTPGLGYFWSGCASKTKWGLEIGGIAAIDIDNHTAFHLDAKQTIYDTEKDNLVSHYANLLIDNKESLFQISKYVVVDAYFAKETFINKLANHNFDVITRLRDDANLMYLYKGEKRKGRGRPQKHDGKINFKSLNNEHFNLLEISKIERLYCGIVFSKSLKKNIAVTILYTKNTKKDKWSHKIFMSTDLNLSGQQILQYYRTRFQIEFLYRDGKQFTGLNDCQARSVNKLDFQFNMSLTTINIAKIAHWLSKSKDQRKSFSMSDIKTMYHNELLVNRFLIKFGINQHLTKNKKKILQLLDYGKITA
jgi:hypothetical protein